MPVVIFFCVIFYLVFGIALSANEPDDLFYLIMFGWLPLVVVYAMMRVAEWITTGLEKLRREDTP